MVEKCYIAFIKDTDGNISQFSDEVRYQKSSLIQDIKSWYVDDSMFGYSYSIVEIKVNTSKLKFTCKFK